jgi:hypothetical protein
MGAGVRYAKTRDGVSIAYTSTGRGWPIVFVSNPCELLQNPPTRRRAI